MKLDCVPIRKPRCLLRLQLNEERSVRNFECRLRTRSGEIRDCVVSAEAFRLGDEDVALVATQDVSEQRKLEKQLRHSQKLEAVGQFAAGVAHDFNNMLTVIQGHASMHLTANNLEKDVADSLNQVGLAAERAAALTRQLLTFSRKQIVQPRVLDLNRTVGNLHDMLRRVIGEHIDLSCDCAPNLPPIHADESNMEQVVVNLVVNARDAMPQGGYLQVRTEAVEVDKAHVARHSQARPGHYVRLSLADTGSGMDAVTLGRIFEPFFTTKEVGKGTGLGLATVYGIVSQQGGWIEVTSVVDQGTDVKIYLPVNEAPADCAGAECHRCANSAVGTKRSSSWKTNRRCAKSSRRSCVVTATMCSKPRDGPEAITMWAERKAPRWICSSRTSSCPTASKATCSPSSSGPAKPT